MREHTTTASATDTMTGRQRLLTALGGGTPDRLPVTIHQWQAYHLKTYLPGMDVVQAFAHCQLDASVTPPVYLDRPGDAWRVSREPLPDDCDGQQRVRTTITTPDGQLSTVHASNALTVYAEEHLIKTRQDALQVMRWWPGMTLDRPALSDWSRRTGDLGIVRGFVGHIAQPGPWQEFCELVGTQEAIFWALDDPDFVHDFLDTLTRQRVAFVREQLPGAAFDLIEHGGGAASANVISPDMFDTFCVPYDRRIIDAIHQAGLPVVYHTCGHMLPLLERIPANGCDASETLSPPGVGGDIRPADRGRVKQVLGTKVALIGGFDQGELLSGGDQQAIEAQVQDLFATFGRDGGYICSASDHFFDVDPRQLQLFAQAAHRCRY